MLYDRDGKKLWLADDTGGFEILQPGGGFNGRTREPGEPDWWVVAKDPEWQPPGMMLARAPEPSPGKLAGADCEAGRKEPPPEPWTLFSAGQEHLDHIDSKGFGEAVQTIGSGIGEAVEKGAEGAGDALSQTWGALTTNEDLKKGVEFGGKAAWEVTKDVAKTVRNDIGFNGWDTAASEAASTAGWSQTAGVLGNPAITVPLNKAISMGRVVRDVWGGKQERDTLDLDRRIDNIYEGVYGRKR